jgi:ABC-type multidrug transport system fused ATPase/permease subunit
VAVVKSVGNYSSFSRGFGESSGEERGEDITKLIGESFGRLFSVVTQDAPLFYASIRDNIGYGKMGFSHIASCKLAELSLKEGKTQTDGEQCDNDFSLEKVCGEKGAKLLGGQQVGSSSKWRKPELC